MIMIQYISLGLIIVCYQILVNFAYCTVRSFLAHSGFLFFLLEKQKKAVLYTAYILFSCFFCYRFFYSKQGTKAFCRYGNLVLEGAYIPWELHLWFCKSCISGVFESGVGLFMWFCLNMHFPSPHKAGQMFPLLRQRERSSPAQGSQGWSVKKYGHHCCCCCWSIQGCWLKKNLEEGFRNWTW